MLNLTPYFERLLAALPFNEKLRKSFNIYIGTFSRSKSVPPNADTLTKIS